MTDWRHLFRVKSCPRNERYRCCVGSPINSRCPRKWGQSSKTALGLKGRTAKLPSAEDAPVTQTPFWYVEGCSRAWLDQQNDVTVKDVKLSHQEGFRSVEHLKRYTTLGMATDQGKTSNLGGLAIMAELAGKSIPEVGTTIFRPHIRPQQSV